MQKTVAIQPDDYTDPKTPEKKDSSSRLWAVYLKEAGIIVRWVDVYRPDIIRQLDGCDGLMWRWAHCKGMYRIAKRLFPVVDTYMGIAAYPNQATCWHYDDKVAQTLLFAALDIPTPRTWVFFNRDDAITWAEKAMYPVVVKLAAGAGSSNVALIGDISSAKRFINNMFSNWNNVLPVSATSRGIENTIASLRILLRGRSTLDYRDEEPQKGYVYFQEYLKGNTFDTRITVIGNRAFAFRRFVRDDDFRASGSGKICFLNDRIDQRFIRIAFDAASKLRTQSLAVDALYTEDGQPVIGEISYTYASWAVHDCPGHWVLDGDAESGELHWIEGNMWPEVAQVADFLALLKSRD